MQHLHGVVQGEDVLVCLQDSVHLSLLAAAAHEGSCKQLLTQRHRVVLVGSIGEDDAVMDSLLLTPLHVWPQLILETTSTGLDVRLAEWLHLIFQADNLQETEQTCLHTMTWATSLNIYQQLL